MATGKSSPQTSIASFDHDITQFSRTVSHPQDIFDGFGDDFDRRI